LLIANYFGIDLNSLITSDLENELGNKKLTDIKQLPTLLIGKNESLTKEAVTNKKIIEKETRISDEYKKLQYKIENLNNELKNALNENFKLKDKIIESNEKRDNKPLKLKSFKYLLKANILANFSIAVVILSIIFIGVNHIINLKELSEDDIFDMYYKPYREDIFKSGNYPLSKIKENYAFGNYYGVLEKLKGITDKDTLNLDKHFYQGLAYLELWQFQSAIESFTKIAMIKDNNYSSEARWYLALCYLKRGQKRKAKDYFEEIIKAQRYKKEEAKEILKRLKI